MSHIRYFFLLSRPRFWSYLAGPFSIGYLSATDTLVGFSFPEFFGWLLYFLIPANIILYGLNDISDEETDQINNKKHTKEVRVSAKNRQLVKYVVFLTFFISLIGGIFFAKTMLARIVLVLFFCLSYSYSLPPFRFKAKPFIDSLSNSLYILPGIFGYTLITSQLPPLWVMVAGASWTFSMHLFSAVPDIASDKKSGILTTAVFLGKKPALLLCSVAWACSSLLFLLNGISLVALLSLIYVILPLFTYRYHNSVDRIYWWFPYINITFGALLFFSVLFEKVSF